MSAAEFWANTDRSSGCWVWTGDRNKSGYGIADWQGRRTRAYRLAYELTKGPIDPQLCVRHTCDNPPCVRPDHLILGTHQDNMVDCLSRGRKWGVILNDDCVYAARLRHHQAGESIESLAAEYGVSPSAMKSALSGRSWRHVPMVGSTRVGVA